MADDVTRELTSEDAGALEKGLKELGDSGCRLLVAECCPSLLINRLSGTWIIGPVKGERLGFDIDEKYRLQGSPFVKLKKEPYAHCPGTGILVGHSDYDIFTSNEELESTDSFAKGQSNYNVDIQRLLDTGTVVISR